MPLTLYCTVEHLESIWSTFGVAVRADDRDTHASTVYIDNAIEKATTDVNLYLFQVYEPAVIAQSTWVAWCTGVIAAVALAKRRGNSVPQSLLDEYKLYIDALTSIRDGKLQLPGDEGLAPPQFDNTPGVSNLRVDTRYRASVRRVPQTSTQSQQSAARRGYELQGWPYPFPFF